VKTQSLSAARVWSCGGPLASQSTIRPLQIDDDDYYDDDSTVCFPGPYIGPYHLTVGLITEKNEAQHSTLGASVRSDAQIVFMPMWLMVDDRCQAMSRSVEMSLDVAKSLNRTVTERRFGF